MRSEEQPNSEVGVWLMVLVFAGGRCLFTFVVKVLFFVRCEVSYVVRRKATQTGIRDYVA